MAQMLAACNNKMAQMLAAHPEKFNKEDPEVELELEVEVAEESEKKPNEELCDEFMFAMEEDPEMYAAAGLPPPVPLPTSKGHGLRCYCESCDELCRRDKGGKCQHHKCLRPHAIAVL
jgi:hypothetical protein